MSDRKNPAVLGNPFTRRQMILGASVAVGGLTIGLVNSLAAAEEGISHIAEAIHQEPVFKASRKRLYEALTDAKQFEKIVQLSAAVKSGAAPGKPPAEISREPGGAFSFFGGYISGRQIELVPNERIVEAWRASSWAPGSYSIAKFVFTDQGSGTKLIFDHTGFPLGQAEHLAQGWHINYWEPLEKFLAQS